MHVAIPGERERERDHLLEFLVGRKAREHCKFENNRKQCCGGATEQRGSVHTQEHIHIHVSIPRVRTYAQIRARMLILAREKDPFRLGAVRDDDGSRARLSTGSEINYGVSGGRGMFYESVLRRLQHLVRGSPRGFTVYSHRRRSPPHPHTLTLVSTGLEMNELRKLTAEAAHLRD